MKQKYHIRRDSEAGTLIIRESAELDKELFSLLCEETFAIADLAEAAAGSDIPAIMEKLRTVNMYPPAHQAERIAGAVREILSIDEPDEIELAFDDLDFLANPDDEEEEEELSDNSVEIDEILEEDIEEDYVEKNEVKKMKSIKVAEDEMLDIDEEG